MDASPEERQEKNVAYFESLGALRQYARPICPSEEASPELTEDELHAIGG